MFSSGANYFDDEEVAKLIEGLIEVADRAMYKIKRQRKQYDKH